MQMDETLAETGAVEDGETLAKAMLSDSTASEEAT